jgi:NADH:ubiquinone oxidoreductase subunit F (NADH-binding)
MSPPTTRPSQPDAGDTSQTDSPQTNGPAAHLPQTSTPQTHPPQASSTQAHHPQPPQPSLSSPSLPRLLAGIPAHGALGLSEHLALHGPAPSYPRPRRRGSGPALIELIERSGLRGQGGAGFPTGVKLRAVAEQRGRAIVVVNAVEGEPASLKDRTLMQALPHLVLDGAQLAAQAVGAQEVIVCVDEFAVASGEHAARAISERQRTHQRRSGQGGHSPGLGRRELGGRDLDERSLDGWGLSERDLDGRDALPLDAADMRLATVPSHYVAGQETALVSYLNGGRALPAFTPPMVFQHGVRRRPTFVCNAETFAHLALIARYGPDWFRQLGTPSQPGSSLVTLSGAIAHPGVYEIEYGSTLASLLDAAGGALGKPRAVLIGGYGGSWIDGRLASRIVLSDEHLATAHSASLGAGVICVLSPAACPVAEVARLTRWMATQSAGQCGPCVYGLDAIARELEAIAAGLTSSSDAVVPSSATDATQRVARLAALVRRRGACGHPDGVAQMVTSAIDAFGPELSDHAIDGRCAACARPGELPLPTRRGATATVPPRRDRADHEPARLRRGGIDARRRGIDAKEVSLR